MTLPRLPPLGGIGRFARRSRKVALLAAVVGLLTGAVVAGFERVVNEGAFEHLLDAPLVVQAVVPTVGLVVAALALRWLAGRATPSTADEYIKSFHQRDRRLDLRPVVGRAVASAATLGSGAAMGFEGPSIYLGAAIGSALQARLRRFFAREDAKVLLVAGAAAGVAAIFKAPATGVVFALEVPYQDDLARRMLLPALFAAATSYVVFVAINGTNPLFPVAGAPPFDLRDLGGAALLGLLCGGGARLFAVGLRLAKGWRARLRTRIAVAGASIAALFVIGRVATGESLVLGSGYQAMDWALEGNHAVAAVAILFLVRALATTAAVAGGGSGGLFVPLVVQGALLGEIVGSAIHSSEASLFPVLGVAGFLGAGYRVPLAAVMFVAETTGRPGFVVPGLIAAAAAQLLMGASSVSPYQQAPRAGHLERRVGLPITSVLRTDAATARPDETVEDLFAHHLVPERVRSLPVVQGTEYCGMVDLEAVGAVNREAWATTTVGSIMRTDVPVGDIGWTLGQALRALETADVDRLAVVRDGCYAGVVTTGEILKLDEILETPEDAPG